MTVAEPSEALTTRDAYAKALRDALLPALCLTPYPSTRIERHDKPVVETEVEGSHLRLPPRALELRGRQRCLIEAGINSCRVSFSFSTSDELERALVTRISTFLAHRYDQLGVVRRRPLGGYDITFLVRDVHLSQFSLPSLVDFLVGFSDELATEVSAGKLSLRTTARALASAFWQGKEAEELVRAAAAEKEGGAAESA